MDNHFLFYVARLQDAGVASLWVSLGLDKDGTRLMHVSADMTNGEEMVRRFPTRTFQVTGKDPVLEQIEDDLVYEGDGVTEERLAAAIAANPKYRDDLTEFGERWLALGGGNDLESAEMDEQEENGDMQDLVAMADKHMQFVKGLMRGLDSNRAHEAARALPSSPSPASQNGD
jgi:predicted HD phosphohydrolase